MHKACTKQSAIFTQNQVEVSIRNYTYRYFRATFNGAVILAITTTFIQGIYHRHTRYIYQVRNLVVGQ